MIEEPIPECSGQHEPRVDGDRDDVDDVLSGDGHVEDPLAAELVSPPDGSGVGVEGGHDPASAAVPAPFRPDDDGGVLWSLPKPK